MSEYNEPQEFNEPVEIEQPALVDDQKSVSLEELMGIAPAPVQPTPQAVQQPEPVSVTADAHRINEDADGLVDGLFITPPYDDRLVQPQVKPSTVSPKVVQHNPVELSQKAPAQVRKQEDPLVFDLNSLPQINQDVPQPQPQEQVQPEPVATTEKPVEETPSAEVSNSEANMKKLEELAKAANNKTLLKWDWSKVREEGYERQEPSAPIARHKLRDFFSQITEVDLNELTDEEKVELYDNRFIIPADSEENMAWVLKNCAPFYENPSRMAIAEFMSEQRAAQGGEASIVIDALKDETAGAQFGYQIGNGKPEGMRNITMAQTEGKQVAQKAKALMRHAINSTGYQRVHLSNSGLVAIVSAPSVEDMLTFYYRSDELKIFIGRTRGGNTYGAVTHALNSLIMDLFIDNLVYISAQDSSRENLRTIISPFDIPTMASAMVSCNYPDGVEFTRVGVNEDGQEETLTGKIHMPDTEITLNNRLSEKQKHFLSKSNSTRQLNEEILSYQNNWQSKEAIGDDNLYVVHSRPSDFNGEAVTIETCLRLTQGNMERYSAHGEMWNAKIQETVNSVFASNLNENTRSMFLFQSVRLTALRDYSNYIEEIVVRTVNAKGEEVVGRSTISEQEDVFDNLDELCQSATVLEKSVKIINQWISKQLKVVYAVPVYSNKEKQNRKAAGEEFIHVVPISPVTSFFTTAVLKFQEHGTI